MIIKLEAINEVKIKQYDAIEVVGTRVDNNESWRKTFFANEKELRQQLDDFGLGDYVNVKMKQNGKFWNIVEFSAVSEALLEKAQGGPDKGYGPPTTSPAGQSKSSPSTGKSSGWNGRTGDAYDRSAAIYLAFDMIKSTFTDAALRKLSMEELFGLLTETADKLFGYIHNGEVKGGTAVSGDPLAPPVVD